MLSIARLADNQTSFEKTAFKILDDFTSTSIILTNFNKLPKSTVKQNVTIAF